MFHYILRPCVAEGFSKADLLIHVDLPREVLLEAVQLLAKVFFDHGKQRDLKVLQLGLQRGQLSSLLQRGGQREPNSMNES